MGQSMIENNFTLRSSLSLCGSLWTLLVLKLTHYSRKASIEITGRFYFRETGILHRILSKDIRFAIKEKQH